jgi:hypothetical protein
MPLRISLSRELLYQRYVVDGLTQDQLAAELEVSVPVIHKELVRHKIDHRHHHRTYPCNELYFDDWTPDMAYVLAFITCDGYIHRVPSKPGVETLFVDVTASDVSVLEFIRSQICPTAPLRPRSRYDGRTGKTYDQVNLRIHSKRLLTQLATFGVVPRKSTTLFLPDVPQDCRWSYLRGVIDANGYVSTKKVVTGGKTYMGPRVGITSPSLPYLEGIQEHLVDGVGQIRKAPSACWVWECSRRRDVVAILDQVYATGFCLERKRQKYLEIKAYDERMSGNAISRGSCKPRSVGNGQ